MTMSPSFGSLSEGRHNNFDFLRFLFASLVIYSHSFALLYNGTWAGYDPLLHWTHGQIAFGGLAVDGFFLISGFLITKSWLGSRSIADFAEKRARRILPALAVVLVVTVLVFGPMATSLPLPVYFSSPRTPAYFGFMGTVNLHLTDRLPGVFSSNPLAGRVNGSLWTIRCEALCYGLVAVFGGLKMYRCPAVVLATAIAATVVMAAGSRLFGMGEFADSFRVLVFFLWGMAFYLYRGVVPHSRLLLAVALGGLAVFEITGVLTYFLPLLGGYCVFYFAFSPRLGLQRFARHGDLSYGLYLYAFPMQQLLVSRFAGAWNAGTLTLTAFVLAGLCAVLSWSLVEKRFLRKPHATILTEKRPEPALAGGVR